jgi:hypothetical protein
MYNFIKFLSKHSFRWVLGPALLVCLVSIPVLSQQLGNRLPRVDGTPGLFKTWDAEPIRQGEVFLSLAPFQNHRDPGELTITTLTSGLATGVFDSLEVFGMWEIQKRLEADSIEVYRISPGSRPRPSTTPLGQQLFSNVAPFMDVPLATGRGELYGNVKFNIFSERKGRPFGLSAVGTGKIPGHKTFTGLNRGLSTGDTEIGFGVLLSKRLGDSLQLHANALRIYVGHPTIDGVAISDLNNRFVVRAGGAFNVSSTLQATAEFESFNYFYWHNVAGLNPTDPVDIIVGLRTTAPRGISFGGGYVASVKRIAEDPARGIRPGSIHGFVVQLGLALQRE